MSDEIRELLSLREHLGSLAGFGGVRVAQCLSFLYCDVFVCLRPVSFVPNDFSGRPVLRPLFQVWRTLTV